MSKSTEPVIVIDSVTELQDFMMKKMVENAKRSRSYDIEDTIGQIADKAIDDLHGQEVEYIIYDEVAGVRYPTIINLKQQPDGSYRREDDDNATLNTADGAEHSRQPVQGSPARPRLSSPCAIPITAEKEEE